MDVGKTLREQGIDESETVLLRRKFFFSDQNIDSRDPVQLNLLYVQARDAILDGTHPVTQRKGKCYLFFLFSNIVEIAIRCTIYKPVPSLALCMFCVCYLHSNTPMYKFLFNKHLYCVPYFFLVSF